MNRLPASTCLSLLLCACGAGGDSAQFSAPRELPKDQRQIVWDATSKERLALQDMGAAKPAGATSVTAADTPSGWKELPANPARFRNAVWQIEGQPDTDCYLTIGVGGGVEGNLARWYSQQFGISKVPAVESLPRVPFAGRSGWLAEIEGTFSGKADWAALIAFFGEGQAVTSLKFTGPRAAVVANRDAFLALARSIRLGAGGAAQSPQAAPPIDPNQPMPPGHPPMGGDAPPVAASPFTADVPVGWQPKAGSSRPLHHTFGAEGEVYVSQLGGQLKGSLDIWRGEVGQGPMSPEEFEALPKTMFLGDDAVLMDLRGTFRGMTGKQIEAARLMVVARVDDGAITFCKLVGPAADVDAQYDAFLAFCGSVRRSQ